MTDRARQPSRAIRMLVMTRVVAADATTTIMAQERGPRFSRFRVPYVRLVGINDRLVTNTHVPMMYLTSLPIEADKIGPLK